MDMDMVAPKMLFDSLLAINRKHFVFSFRKSWFLGPYQLAEIDKVPRKKKKIQLENLRISVDFVYCWQTKCMLTICYSVSTYGFNWLCANLALMHNYHSVCHYLYTPYYTSTFYFPFSNSFRAGVKL